MPSKGNYLPGESEAVRSRTTTSWMSRGIILLSSIFVFTTLVQGAIAFIPINKIIGFLILLLMFMRWASIRHTRMQFIGMFCLAFVLMPHCVLFGAATNQEITDWAYFASTLFLMSLLGNKEVRTEFYECMLHYRIFILIVAVLSCVLLCALLATHAGYAASWGGELYFTGLCNSEHTLASACLALMGILLFLSHTSRGKFLFLVLVVVPLIALMETGARVFLISGAVMVFLFINILVRRTWLKLFVFVVVGIIAVASFGNSGMMDKFNFVESNIWADSPLAAITNGRNEIWATDLLSWVNSGPFGVFLGQSFSSIYELNKNVLTLEIWAHNDLIMVLYGTGVVGFIIYSGSLVAMLADLKKDLQRVIFWLLVLYLVLPLILNGFFPYQHFVYAFTFTVLTCMHFDSPERKGDNAA